MAMRLTDAQVEWLDERVPGAPVNPKGGRPAMDKRQALRGIFWILDNGAKWKDLPRAFGSKNSVHKYFTMWVRSGVFEDLMRDAGELVEERGGYRLYECFIDATFSKARGGGDGVG
jgi:transposase